MKNQKTLLDGNAAAAWAARLSNVKVVPNFPITPQTEIIETLAKWKETGEWKGEFVPMESEHSVLSAAIASEATGARTFTASSSQGLLLMHEMHYIASGMRLPIVMANCSRGLSAPITLWSDLNDILALRDSGWMIFFAKNNQEVLDIIIQSYKIAEDRNVLLPAIINMDGFILSYTREPMLIPSEKDVNKFLPEYKPNVLLDIDKPMSLGVPVLNEYMYFKSQQRKASLNALKIIPSVFKDFKKRFGRNYSMIEEFKTNDADIIFVVVGSLSTIIQSRVIDMRKQGIKAGVLRILCYRPFPEKAIEKALKNCRKVIVIENNISPGSGGILSPEIKSIAKNTTSLIISLGGRSFSKNEFIKVSKKIISEKNNEEWLM